MHLIKLHVGPDVKQLRIATGFHMTMMKTCVLCLKFVLKLINQNYDMYLAKRNALLRILVSNVYQTLVWLNQRKE